MEGSFLDVELVHRPPKDIAESYIVCNMSKPSMSSPAGRVEQVDYVAERLLSRAAVLVRLLVKQVRSADEGTPRLRALGRQYGAQYVLTSIDPPLDLPRIYANKSYAVYELPPGP